jgi:hypothetical protein
MFAPEWRITIAKKAVINKGIFRTALPMVTAITVPYTTGMVETGRAKGLTAIIQVLIQDGFFSDIIFNGSQL